MSGFTSSTAQFTLKRAARAGLDARAARAVPRSKALSQRVASLFYKLLEIGLNKAIKPYLVTDGIYSDVTVEVSLPDPRCTRSADAEPAREHAPADAESGGIEIRCAREGS